MKKDKFGNICLKEKDLVKKLQSMDIKGTGSSEDPFVVDEPFQLPEKTIITESSLYINFVNQDFQVLGVSRSQNIMFENCSFKSLDVFHSSQMRISNCTIKNLIFTGGDDNDFIKCEIENIPQNILSYNNRFLNCKISENVKVLLLKEGGSPILDFIPQVLRLMVLILGISFLSSIVTSLFGIWDWISVIIFGGGFFGVGILFLYVRKVLKTPKEKNENQIINNNKLENT